jgi:predicted Rossmann fold flavoprotein
MTSAPRQFDVVVLGAGAAGLMCAAVAGQRGRRVALLEHNGQPGRKILISGGGRCNFTNLDCGPANFLSENPHFAKSALALYQPRHFLELIERYGIAWHEKTLGQLFCDGSARAILDMLLAECEAGGVQLVLNAAGIQVERLTGGGFSVASSLGEFQAGALVVASGGLSIPKLGATGLGYDLARQFGLGVVEPRPALVPLVLGGDEAGWTALTGVAAEVEAQAGRARFREKMLVTHRGLSGPAVLQASS